MSFASFCRYLFLPLVFAAVIAARPSVDGYAAAAVEARQSFSKPPICPEAAHIIAVSGASNPPHGYGLLITTVEAILFAIPGSSNYSVPYPKMSADVPAAAAIGAEHLMENLEWFTNGCPDTPVVLLGYSLGAIVTLNTLCGRSHFGSAYGPPLPAKYAKFIVATILYGDETRIPNQPYDLGTCTHGEGVDPRANPRGCKSFESTFQSYCDDGDPLCCDGDEAGVHKSYPEKYNNDSTAFVLAQFDARVSARKILVRDHM